MQRLKTSQITWITELWPPLPVFAKSEKKSGGVGGYNSDVNITKNLLKIMFLWINLLHPKCAVIKPLQDGAP